jgi:hypothetical protein
MGPLIPVGTVLTVPIANWLVQVLHQMQKLCLTETQWYVIVSAVNFFTHNITQNCAQQQKSTQFVASYFTNSQQSCQWTMHAGQNSSCSFVIWLNGTSTAGNAEAMPNGITKIYHCRCSEFFHWQYHSKPWATTKISSVRFIISNQQSTIRPSNCSCRSELFLLCCSPTKWYKYKRKCRIYDKLRHGDNALQMQGIIPLTILRKTVHNDRNHQRLFHHIFRTVPK